MIGTLLGGLKAVRNVKAQKLSLDKELSEALNRRNRLTGEDPTRRSDARQTLTELDRRLRDHIRHTAGSVALTGGTEASVAAEKSRATQALGQTMASIATAGERRREAADDDYEQRRREIERRRRELLGLEAREAVKAGGML